MLYDKIIIITRPGDDEQTLLVREKIIKFCECNNILWDLNGSFPRGTKDVLVIAIGGDGTMLGAMRKSLRYPNSIVYGINTGSLGFLSEEFEDNLTTVLSNIGRNFGQIDKRMALTGRVFVDSMRVGDDIIAMNELILSGMTNQSPLKVEVSINKKLVSENVGSGVLVATSTGSTAMALSAGGAIVSPSTNIMQIVPLMAHTLTSRPVITTGRDTISLSTELLHSHQAIEIYGDGIALQTFYAGDGSYVELQINKTPAMVNVFRPHNWDFFNVLRKKLKW